MGPRGLGPTCWTSLAAGCFPGKPGVTTTYGGVAVWVPATFLITIPDVPPGWYRLRVDVMGEFGYLAVEVVEAG